MSKAAINSSLAFGERHNSYPFLELAIMLFSLLFEYKNYDGVC
jgi:hypothetical protein